MVFLEPPTTCEMKMILLTLLASAGLACLLLILLASAALVCAEE